MPLFIKYRPRRFEDCVGQEMITKTLQNALSKDTLAHAYLFSGSRGTGKTSTARILSKALCCRNIGAETHYNPCNTCDICMSIDTDSCPDVLEIDAASNNSVDDIRDLRDKIRFEPSVSKRKIYIIDEVHMLSKSAFNALLKTLEEPPYYAYFILATTEFHKVPETILSRCQTFLYQRVEPIIAAKRLEYICQQESYTYDIKALMSICYRSEGGMRDAIQMLERTAIEHNNTINSDTVEASLGGVSSKWLDDFYTSINNNDMNTALLMLQNADNTLSDMRYFGRQMLDYGRDKMHTALHNNTPIAQYLRILDAIMDALQMLSKSPIRMLPYEMMVIKLCSSDATRPMNSDIVAIKSTPKTINNTPTTPMNTAPVAINTINTDDSDIITMLQNAPISYFEKGSVKLCSAIKQGDTIIITAPNAFHKDKLSNSDTIDKLSKHASEVYKTDIIVEINM